MSQRTGWWKPHPSDWTKPKEESPLAERGSFGGRCFHLTCRTTGAEWRNYHNGRYYCERCAQTLNQLSAHYREPAACVRTAFSESPQPQQA